MPSEFSGLSLPPLIGAPLHFVPTWLISLIIQRLLLRGAAGIIYDEIMELVEGPHPPCHKQALQTIIEHMWKNHYVLITERWGKFAIMLNPLINCISAHGLVEYYGVFAPLEALAQLQQQEEAGHDAAADQQVPDMEQGAADEVDHDDDDDVVQIGEVCTCVMCSLPYHA